MYISDSKNNTIIFIFSTNLYANFIFNNYNNNNYYYYYYINVTDGLLLYRKYKNILTASFGAIAMTPVYEATGVCGQAVIACFVFVFFCLYYFCI
jgi:hypothetical protein